MAEEAKAPAAKEKKKNGKISSAKKRDLQSKKRQEWNSSFNASVRTAIRSFEMSLTKGDKADSMKRLDAVYSLMDRGVKTNRFKLNKAARTKSRLATRLPA
ncbi:MAG: 30S ribosomal protein S20 [Verrucomicrobia bacterium]|nr:30S ribosomal protein S20 [Verrucomicrobiota bacterium]